MSNAIVTVNVSQQIAPDPSFLQKTGALISQGATTLADGARALLLSKDDLTSILQGAEAVTGIVQTAGTATATTTAPHGIPIGDVVSVTIAGASPAGYNGTVNATATGASAFTYPVDSGLTSPATGTIVFTLADVAELTAMVTTFFAQGSSVGVYVLELGPGDAETGVAALDAYIPASAQFFYAYLVPRNWAASSAYLTFVAQFEAPTKKTYFFTTMTTGNYTTFTALMKCVVGMIEAPAIPATEFSLAAAFFVALNYSPSSTQRVTPYSFSYLYGVTPYPTTSNAVLFAALKAAGVNTVSTGAEGGISNAMLVWGTTMDLRPFNYWYSVDWTQINIERDIANAIINGSNDPINPLYYNQDGINRLQAVAAGTMGRGVSYGLVLGTVVQSELDQPELDAALSAGTFAGNAVVNAIPFIAYGVSHPSDYKIGKYGGFAIVYTPARGFTEIVFNLVVTDFVAAAA